MENLKFQIPYYKEINEFFQSIPSEFRTNDPNLYCLRMIENEGPTDNYKPPFRKDFYFIGLVSNAGTTKKTYDNVNVTQLDSFLVFQAPGLIYSFYRDKSAHGYLLYFKKECFSFFKPDFEAVVFVCYLMLLNKIQCSGIISIIISTIMLLYSIINLPSVQDSITMAICIFLIIASVKAVRSFPNIYDIMQNYK